MSDRTVEALRRIKAHAEQAGAVVDRVEVMLHEGERGAFIEFTAHLSPKPLEQTQACTGYFVEGDPA